MMSTTTVMSTSTNPFIRFGSLRSSISAHVEKLKIGSNSGRGITPCDESTELKVINNHHDQNNHSTVIFHNTQTGTIDLPLHPENPFEDENVGSCIICVGSTGTGKSSTVAKYTGSKTKSGSGSERVTQYFEIHRSLQNDDEPVWVDAVGWDDAEVEDQETFKNILKFIDRHNITKVKAVIWNILPNVRKDALLCGQARLIDMFKEEKIWKNVIIVAKQSLNPDHDCQGALKAAAQFTDHQILYTGYRFYEDPTLSAKQRENFVCEETRKTYNIKTDLEVRELLGEKLAELGNPVQVVFKTKRCVNCSAKGDARLLTPYCHMEPTLLHPGQIENFHPGKNEKFHPSNNYVIEHDGRLKKSWYSTFCCGTLRKPRFTCCRRREGKAGCQKKWACCKADWELQAEGCQLRHGCCGAVVGHRGSNGCSTRYACCSKAVNSTGCKKVCKKCEKDWGSKTDSCFKKDHELVDVNQQVNAGVGGGRRLGSNLAVNVNIQTPEHGSDQVHSAPADLEQEELQPFLHRTTNRLRKSFTKMKLPPIVTYHMI